MRQSGFTLTELILVIVIAGILGAVVYSKVDVASFKAEGNTDQVKAAIRYAHKLAVAQRKSICVSVVGNDVSLRYFNTLAGTCGSAVVEPPGSAAFSVTTPGATLSAEFLFDVLGRPSPVSTCVLSGGVYVCTPATTAITLSLTGGTRTVTIEPQTGFVH